MTATGSTRAAGVKPRLLTEPTTQPTLDPVGPQVPPARGRRVSLLRARRVARRGPPVDYGDKPAAAKRSLLTPPRWSLFCSAIDNMDSSVSPTHGGQEGSAYNGHFGCSCYHPLFVFNQFGDLERCALRAGNVHSAHGWRDVLEHVVARYRDRRLRRYFRGDAAFASPDLYEFLEAEGYKYAIPSQGQRGSSGKHRPSADPPRRSPAQPCSPASMPSFSYQAGSWSSKRRVVAKIEWHSGQLFPRVGFIVTNLSRPAERVTKFYNGRGTAEQYIKEGKNAINWTRLSCHSFRNNEVRLQLRALAYNLANFMRPLALPKEVEHWSLTTLREKLVKIGAKVVSHGRYVTFQLAEVAVPRALFAEILRLIDGLRPAPLPP